MTRSIAQVALGRAAAGRCRPRGRPAATPSESRSAVEYTATDSRPSSRQARTTRTAISPRFATRHAADHGRTGSSSNSGWPYSTASAFSTSTRRTTPATLALELVEQLHRLEDAQRLADRDLVADGDEGRIVGRRRRVERADHRALDHHEVRRRGVGRRHGGRRERRAPRPRGTMRSSSLRSVMRVPSSSIVSSERPDSSSSVDEAADARLLGRLAPRARSGVRWRLRMRSSSGSAGARRRGRRGRAPPRRSRARRPPRAPRRSRRAAISAGVCDLGQRAHAARRPGRASGPTRRARCWRRPRDVPVQRRPLRTWSMACAHEDAARPAAPAAGGRSSSRTRLHLGQHLVAGGRTRRARRRCALRAGDEAGRHAVDAPASSDTCGRERRRQRLADAERAGRRAARPPRPADLVDPGVEADAGERLRQQLGRGARCVGTATG